MTLTSAELLKYFAVPTMDGVFVLSCFARRITVYDQQVRALNLVDALVKEDKLKRGDYVTVVGGGLGGLTAAAAAAHVDAYVRVIDEGDQPLRLQRRSHQRWLHPHVADWPHPGSDKAEADLPFLDWTANPAIKVAEKIAEEWKKRVMRHSIQESFGIKVKGIREEAGRWFLETNPEKEEISRERNSIVILAAGFGIEKDVPGHAFLSYWDNDNIDRAPLDRPGEELRYLISGSGDGALIDVMRICLQNFNHYTVLEDLGLMTPGFAEIRKKLIQIDKDARKISEPVEQSKYLKGQYDRLRTPAEFDDILRGRKRPQTQVVLATKNPYIFDLKSFILQRFLVSTLIRIGLVEHHQGELIQLDGQKPCVKALLNPEIANPIFFDVVVRIGPKSALSSHLNAIAELCATALKPSESEPDPTRIPSDWSAWTVRSEPLGATMIDLQSQDDTYVVAYHVTSEGAQKQILGITCPARGFAAHDKSDLLLPIGGATKLLVLFRSVERAKRITVEKFGRDGALIEVQVPKGSNEPKFQRPAKEEDDAPIIYMTMNGDDYILVRDLSYIKSPRLFPFR